MNGLSIRWRLTLWNTLALGVLLLVFGALVYGLLRRASYAQTDRLLASQFDELKQDPRMALDYRHRLPHWVREFAEHVNVFAIVYDSSGNVFARTEELPSASVSSGPPEAGPELRFSSRTVAALGSQRTLVGRLPLEGEEFTVLLMAPLAEIEEDLARVLTVLGMAGPISLVFAAGIGYWLARKSLAPIEQLRVTTDQITAERLDRRLKVANPNDELGHLAQTINAMIARLERSFAEIVRFTADASHELRTPIAVIRTETEVALGRTPKGTQTYNLLGSVLEECERLTRLTDQLLTLSREDAGISSYAPQPVDLKSLVTDVAETMRPLADAKRQRVTLNVQHPVSVSGDPARLRRVFYNLLDNAIKYTEEGGTIDVLVKSSDQAATVEIRDTGPGIPSEHLPQVFERFYRVDKARGRTEGGTGLGLSIAQSIVVAHGGRIKIDSAAGEGSTCVVELPAADD